MYFSYLQQPATIPFMNSIFKFFQSPSKKSNTVNHTVDISKLNVGYYGYHHNDYWDKLELVKLDDLSYSFRFVHKNEIKEACSFQLTGVAKNIDPEGLSKMDFFDPEGEFNATEVFDFDNEHFHFEIYLPLVRSFVVGIKLNFKEANKCKITEHKSTLTQYDPEHKNNNKHQQSNQLHSASLEEVAEVQTQINNRGYWEAFDEWRISTTTVSRIELKNIDGDDWYITTVKCEQEVMIPCKTIVQAIIFKKAYFDFQIELFKTYGWASRDY